MENIIEFFKNNYEWIFSGLGIFILSGVFFLIKKKSAKIIKQKQKSGNNSINVQAGNSVEFNQKNDR